ncbi:MAG: potassium transporter TrkH, partial [Allgaiera sp.]|nr:potassium transporter TrkH [Allgaiera sp.]
MAAVTTAHDATARDASLIDLRPVGFVLGLLLVALGLAMLAPLVVDLLVGASNWRAFFESGMVTGVTGAMIALACRSGLETADEFSVRDAWFHTPGVGAWLPRVGARA